MSSLQMVLKPIWYNFRTEPWRQVLRPGQCLLAGLGSAIIAIYFSTKMLPIMALFGCFACSTLSCLGASLFHFGTRSAMYERKTNNPVKIHTPLLLVQMGAIFFALSIAVAHFVLPSICFTIALFNFVAITLYGMALDRVWPFKNIVATMVCITPIIIGWASVSQDIASIKMLAVAAFGLYLTREILKDIDDIEANHGLRFTLIMYFGENVTLKIAGLVLLASVVMFIIAMPKLISDLNLALIIYLLGTLLLLIKAVKCLINRRLNFNSTSLDLSTGLILAALLSDKLMLP